jgi:hypothetical protein
VSLQRRKQEGMGWVGGVVVAVFVDDLLYLRDPLLLFPRDHNVLILLSSIQKECSVLLHRTATPISSTTTVLLVLVLAM